MDTEKETPRASDDVRPTPTTTSTPKTAPTTTTTAMTPTTIPTPNTTTTTSQPAVQDPPPPHHPPPGSQLPPSAVEAASPEGKTPATGVQGSAGITRDPPPPPPQPPALPGSEATPPAGPTAEGRRASPCGAPVPHPHSFHGPTGRAKSSGTLPPSPLPLNHVTEMAASHNKLPTSKVKAIVTRMGRHTQSSAGKLGRWYKNESYVDNSSYSWRNMALFADYQKQMYTAFGTVKASCKK